MAWWFHLLVRHVENLSARKKIVERLVRSVGRFEYAGLCKPLLRDLRRFLRRPPERNIFDGYPHSRQMLEWVQRQQTSDWPVHIWNRLVEIRKR